MDSWNRNAGLIGNMLSTFNLNQIMEILNNWDDDHIMTIHEATTGENVEGSVKSLKNWVTDISKSFNCKFYL